MTIQTLCTRCRVTRKAVAYAIEQGLLTPAVAENGYRSFTEDDARTMEKIAALRALGFSTADIRQAFASPDWTALCRARAVALAAMQEKQRILNTLAAEGDWSAAREAIDRLTSRLPITERLKLAFPGPFGGFLAAHFAPYLTEPAITDAQHAAFEEAVSWLDGTTLDIPADLAEAYEQMADAVPAEVSARVADRMEAALRDPSAYIQAHAEEIAQWQALKASEVYRNSPAGRMEQRLRAFLAQSGYNTVLIPALRRLSPKYEAYQQRLEAANAVFSAALDEKTKENP